MTMEMPKTTPCIRKAHIKDIEHAYAEYWMLHRRIESLEKLSVTETNEYKELYTGLLYLEKSLNNVERIVGKYELY